MTKFRVVITLTIDTENKRCNMYTHSEEYVRTVANEIITDKAKKIAAAIRNEENATLHGPTKDGEKYTLRINKFI